MTLRLPACTALLAIAALAQNPVSPPSITAYGEASIAIKPDLAHVSLGVVTESKNAADAAAKNATQAVAVIAAIRSVLGKTAEIKTASFSVNPVYQYPPAGGQPFLNGFAVNNVLLATVSDLAVIGRLIDEALKAGANRVEGIQFGLKDEEPARAEALRAAAQKARAKASVIAAGLGVRTGPVVAVREGVDVTPLYPRMETLSAARAAPATPVEAGTLEIRASVTLQVAIQ